MYTSVYAWVWWKGPVIECAVRPFPSSKRNPKFEAPRGLREKKKKK
jgi:hypothetical protein